MTKNCIVCGEPCGMYTFCKKCNELKENGKIKKCELCKSWYNEKDGCNCTKNKTIELKKDKNKIHIISFKVKDEIDEVMDFCVGDLIEHQSYGIAKIIKVDDKNRVIVEYENKEIGTNGIKDYSKKSLANFVNLTYEENYADSIIEEKTTDKKQNIISENTCTKCGKSSGKYEICYDCYRKKIEEDLKKDNETLIESEKDSGIDIREKWLAKIRTKVGVKVRSQAECRIADWLSEHNYTFQYEQKVIDKTNRKEFLLCDFFLPQAKIYIEYWGYKDRETYNKRRAEKIKIYNNCNLTMIDMESKDLEVLDDRMKEILSEYLPDDLKQNFYV